MTSEICDVVLGLLDKPLKLEGEISHQSKYVGGNKSIMNIPAGFSLFTSADAKFKYVTTVNGETLHAAHLYLTLPTDSNKSFLAKNPRPDQEELNDLDRIIFHSETDEKGTIDTCYTSVELDKKSFIYVKNEEEKLLVSGNKRFDNSRTEEFLHNKDILIRGNELMVEVMDVFEAQKYIDMHFKELKEYNQRENPSIFSKIGRVIESFSN